MAGPIDSRLLTRARATRGFLVAGVGVGIATAILVICQAWLLSRSVVSIFDTHTLSIAQQLVGWLLLVFLARAVLAWAQSVLAVRASARVKSQLRADVVRAHLARPTAAAASSSSLINIVTKGLDALDGYYAKYLPQLGLAATVPFIVGGVILWRDWPSALIIAFTLPLIPVFMALIGWTTQAATQRRFATQQRLANHFADLIEGLPTLQAFGRALAQRRGVEITESANRRETMRTLYVSFLSAFALELLATLSVAVVAVTVGFRVVFGEVSFETALFVLILAPEAFLPVRQVGVHYHDSADGVAAADAAFEIIDAATTGPKPTPGAAAGVSLRFSGVGYSYPGTDAPALSDFDLELAPGEIVALAGPSGAGKSTALALLMGFISPDSGRITYGDDAAVGANPAAWRDRLAWVAQNPGLINGSVGDNLRLGNPDASPIDFEWALGQVGADFAASKWVGDDGEGLSAGERRRVALARALLRIAKGNATLLVLDEPTAGLDADTEAKALAAVRESGAGALVVSHRGAVLAQADRVVSLVGSNA